MVVTSGKSVMNVWLLVTTSSSPDGDDAEGDGKREEEVPLLQHVGCVAGSGLAMGVSDVQLTCLSQNSNKGLKLLNTQSATRVDLQEAAGRLALCGAFSSRRKARCHTHAQSSVHGTWRGVEE